MRGGDGLFEVESVEKKRPQGRAAGVDKRFRAFDPHQVLLLPPSLDDWLPRDHLARFVVDLVDEVLDLGPILADCTEARGYPPYDPRLTLRLLIYGYTTGVRSSRAIERRCADDVAFRFLAADQAPGFRSISRFRRRHLDALAGLFTQSLHLATKLGMVKMGRVALDGTKLEANASKHKAMSYGRLVDKEERIEAFGGACIEIHLRLADLVLAAGATYAEHGRDVRAFQVGYVRRLLARLEVAGDLDLLAAALVAPLDVTLLVRQVEIEGLSPAGSNGRGSIWSAES